MLIVQYPNDYPESIPQLSLRGEGFTKADLNAVTAKLTEKVTKEKPSFASLKLNLLPLLTIGHGDYWRPNGIRPCASW